ncbi:MAG: hypothetical protein AB7D43_09790 [Sulfurimonadaceae bacterium]
MKNNIQMDLKNNILNKMKEDDFDNYSKILLFIEITKIDEIIKDRYSVRFLLDLFFGFDKRMLNIESIMHEIRFVEGLEKASRTKPASQFRRPPLKGLWHKHYFDGSIPSLAQNLKNALGSYGMPYVDSMIAKAKASGKESFITPEDVPKIVDDAVSSNLQRRRAYQKITGEWLVYVIHENTNYFLCLAKHDESDADIRKKIDSICIYEFSFLKSILLPSIQNTERK